ncbi:addiction module protein [Leucobacter insecticola]|uniref:Addiction module protein n=1 Tax=Leucobacter insecticola TaxID=2714934 RepID=A0A6G8FHY8_9MICO|nr:addiction module protein [Leucobacter insecticola]QIM15977.1 addiction module protein [Leucobacter insecticola]
MNSRALEVERALLALDSEDRAEVIHRGLQSLDPEPVEHDEVEIEAAWRSELRGRVAEVEGGEVELLDLDESLARIRAKIATQFG